MFPGINRSETVDLWNSGSSGPAAPSTPLQGWVLLSHVLRPPLMSLSAHCHLHTVTVAPAVTNPVFPAGFGAQDESVSGPQSPRLAGGCRQHTLGASPFAISLRGFPVPWSPPAPCDRVAVLCPRKQSWFNLCFSSSCQAVPVSPPRTRQCTHVYTRVQRCLHLLWIALYMGRETYALKHMCICFPSQIYFGKYESAAAAAAAGKNILHNLREPRKPHSLLGGRLSASSSFYHHFGATHWPEPLGQVASFPSYPLVSSAGKQPQEPWVELYF